MDIVHKGIVSSFMDSIVLGYNLDKVFIGEIVQFKSLDSDILGVVMNIESNNVKIVLIQGDDKKIKAGDLIYRTHNSSMTKAGFGVLGRVLDPMGNCLNYDNIKSYNFLINEIFNIVNIPIDLNSPSIIEREPVRSPLFTGINSVDTLIPIGSGQRELLVGDLGTGKTTLAITFILNQREINKSIWREIEIKFHYYKHLFFISCIYVVIGGKRSELSRIQSLLNKLGALKYTTVVFSSADNIAGVQYLAPYSGCAIGEWFRDNGYKSIVVYDDLSNHAAAYRQLSLLLRRPPGREAYPGDIFYIHSRLLERASQKIRNLGGGSLTSFPIVTTKGGDISGYIPTNVISITDGQLVLSLKLANEGIFPAIDLNGSVSRVGSDAQIPILKEISKQIKIDYSLYKKYAGIEKLGGNIPESIINYINRGKKLVKFFNQDMYETTNIYKQIICLYALGKGILDFLKPELISYYFDFLFDKVLLGDLKYLDNNYSFYFYKFDSMEFIIRSLDIDIINKDLNSILNNFNKLWNEYFNDKISNFVKLLKGE